MHPGRSWLSVQPGTSREALLVPAEDLPLALEQFVEALQLGPAERGLQAAHPVLVAELVGDEVLEVARPCDRGRGAGDPLEQVGRGR